ncbi:MAG: restriction endonuclease [Nitrospirota bacterium]
MTPTIFNSLSHSDFLRLTLEAFSRQGFEVERSTDSGADAVLVGKSGDRIAVLCKKYRDAFIGRPVLQQFHTAMGQIGCREGYLITTTDCLPEAHEFAHGKGLELFNRDRTTRLFLSAFGDEFMRTGRIPELGHKARVVPAPVKKPVSAATYEKVADSDRKNEREPGKPNVSTQAPEPERPPVLVQAPEPVKLLVSAESPEPDMPPGPAAAPEPAKAPEPVAVPEPERPSVPIEAPEPEQATEPAQAAEQGTAPPEDTVNEELPEEVESVESLEPSVPSEAASLKNTRTIFCAECNQQTRVPTDQGMIKVTCTECGSLWLYQPEMNSNGEVKTTTIIACQTCSQQLNVPVNRGQLNVRCPKCGNKWVFTP